MFKVMTIVGTRPEIIKLSEVIKEMDRSFEHILVHTGQHYDYELSKVFFDDLGVRAPDVCLDVVQGSSAIQAISQIFISFEKVLDTYKPDAILVYGDTNSCLCAYVAKRKQIPIFHMEAGNRCFDARVPEEVNRKIIDHLADVNMTITEHARRNLLDEGLPTERIFKIGSSMQQVQMAHYLKITKASTLGVLGVVKEGYILVSIHREENTTNEAYMECFHKMLCGLRERFNVSHVIVSTHPRTRKALEKFGEIEGVLMMPPFGFIDYMKLQIDAKCVISDSGTIAEESSLWGFSAVTIRDSMERPEILDAGGLIVTTWDVERIYKAVEIVSSVGKPFIIQDYNAGDVAQKVVFIIASQIHQIRNKVYYKS